MQDYVVVARRYRPGNFTDLVGQDHISRALATAIDTGRVGHAYLFTGARGVGKTSSARIFAKGLNCEQGPTAEPCGKCESCIAVSTGDDVDVLEIDGASNRGIDEIRQLRANVGVRPSRSRFKIYIIDEVHMLTGAAFNALLKTLEEPPEHVKFIFCTTDPEKIPITVLSRCQRFDFAPVSTDEIMARLKFIVENEGVKADDQALALIARRAGGSVRDSQSLLEQLIAFGGEHLTTEDIHALLGTAGTARLSELVEKLADRDSAAVMVAVDTLLREGAQPAQLAEQTLTLLRDLLALAVGAPSEVLLLIAGEEVKTLQTLADRMGPETLLAMAGLLDQSLVKMRQSTYARTLLEIALVRICRLEQLDQIADLARALATGSPIKLPASSSAAPAKKPATAQKKNEPLNSGSSEVTSQGTSALSASATESQPSVAAPVSASHQPQEGAPSPANTPATSGSTNGNHPQTVQSVEPARQVQSAVSTSGPDKPFSVGESREIWRRMMAELGDTTAEMLAACDLASSAANRLVATFPAGYSFQMSSCEQPIRKQRIEQALTAAAGRPVHVEFAVKAGGAESGPAQSSRPVTRLQLLKEVQKRDFVRAAVEIFDGDIVRVDPPKET